MPDPLPEFRSPARGALRSILDWIDELGQVPLNLLRGDLGAAGRHVLNLGAQALDAPLPGDWIPELANQEDYTTPTELLGIDRAAHPILAGATDFVGETLVNPLTWIPGTAIAKGIGKVAGLGANVVRKLPAGAEILDDAGALASKYGSKLRSVAGVQRLTPEQQAIRDAARAGSIEAVAGEKAIKKSKYLSKLTSEESDIVGDVIDDYNWQDGKLVGKLSDLPGKDLTGNPAATALDRVRLHPGVTPENVEKIAGAVQEATALGKNQKLRPGIFDDGALARLSDEYLGRKYTGQSEEQAINEALGTFGKGMSDSAPLKGIKLDSVEKVQKFLANNPKSTYVRSAIDRLAQRTQTQGSLAGRADMAKKILELARSGKINLPAGLVEDAARALPDFKAPVPPPGTVSPSVEEMLGSRAPDSVYADLLSPGSGRAAPPAGGMEPPSIDDLLAGRSHGGPVDPYNVGGASGRSKPPGSAPMDGLPDDALASYGMGIGSGRARPPASSPVPPIEDMLGRPPEIAPDPYSIGMNSGRAKPPASSLEPTDIEDMLGPAASAGGIDDVLRGHGIGVNSGKARPPLGEPTLQPLSEAQLAKGRSALLGKDAALSDPATHTLVDGIIRDMASNPETAEGAKVLSDLWSGMAPRQGLSKFMAENLNPYFKKAAVYGYVIPKIGGAIRNKLSGVWQSWSNPASRGVTIGQAKRLDGDIIGAIGDAFGFRYGRDALKSKLMAVDDALGASGGLASNAQEILRASGHKDMAEMLGSGVLDGYVRSEDLAKGIIGSGMKKKLMSIADWPAIPFRGVEDRMRVGMWMDLRAAGKSADEAGKIVRDSLYDYSISSAGNRTARDFIPFFQFQAKATVQQTKLLAEKPRVAAMLSAAMGGPSANPKYPYMEGKLNIPTGYDSDGKLSYLTGFGLPFESLSQIPNPSGSLRELGDDTMRDVIGSAQPLLKTAASAAFNKDPYFGTEFGQYDRIPVVGHAGAVGRGYNVLAQSGLIAPIDAALRGVDSLTNSHHSIPVRMVDVFTGAHVASVDPDQAMQQQLDEILGFNPDVGSVTSLYSKSHDPETQALIRALREAKQRAKANRPR